MENGCVHCTNACIAHAEELVMENGCVQFTWEREEEAKNRIWRARHEWLYAGQTQLSIGRDVSQVCCYSNGHCYL